MAAKSRFDDQHGQWKNVTPASVKKKQVESWKKLEKSMSGGKKNTKKKGK